MQMTFQRRKILLSPLFLVGLTILLLNDFYLKTQFHNFFTGKISDFAGLFVFPLFWAAFFPKRKLFIFTATATFFVFWKSSYSQGFIHFWNNLGIFGIGRTVDYSDLIALTVLLPAWIYSGKSEFIKLPEFFRKFALTAVTVISVFAFTATSPPGKMNQTEEYDQVYKFQDSSLEVSKKFQEFKTLDFSQTKSGDNGITYFNVELHEKVCDGYPRANFTVLEGDKAEIKLNHILYPCDDKLPDQNEKLRQMFESEVINFLKDRRPY